MDTVTRDVQATPEQVWACLSDGWAYASWVVGAARVRDVDATWPAEGSRIHHSFGLWPLLINDSTSVLASEPARRLLLRARGWPAGEATVDITLEPRGEGSRVMLEEDATSGPGLLVPQPVRQAFLVPRNVETLRRLAMLAEGHAR